MADSTDCTYTAAVSTSRSTTTELLKCASDLPKSLDRLRATLNISGSRRDIVRCRSANKLDALLAENVL